MKKASGWVLKMKQKIEEEGWTGGEKYGAREGVHTIKEAGKIQKTQSDNKGRNTKQTTEMIKTSRTGARGQCCACSRGEGAESVVRNRTRKWTSEEQRGARKKREETIKRMKSVSVGQPRGWRRGGERRKGTQSKEEVLLVSDKE